MDNLLPGRQRHNRDEASSYILQYEIAPDLACLPLGGKHATFPEAGPARITIAVAWIEMEGIAGLDHFTIEV